MKYKIEKVKDFWNTNCMNYDFLERHTRIKEGSPQFFKRIDDVLFKAAKFNEKDGIPFGRIIPFKKLKGKKVLEIGCGMGSVSQLMAMHEAEVTAVDLTPRAVKNTKKRFKLLQQKHKGLKNLKNCRILEANAEKLPFKKEEFEFVLSWGVIHHSPNTQKCLNEIYRVLKKGGITSGMVYQKNSIVYYGHFMLLRGVLMGKLLKYSPKELADRYSDWYQKGGCAKAEHFTRKEWKKMMVKSGFNPSNVRMFLASEPSDIYPPGTRKILNKVISRKIPDMIFRFCGWFLVWDKVIK
jgi:ubiquinone/menaquinone biosynthesis C-methylase UbiE